MARCGRCGLWNQYPDDHPEKKWAGVCLWYQMRLVEDEVFEPRECGDFFERIPNVPPIEQMNYKVGRDNLRDAYVVARRSRVIAYLSLVISVLALLHRFFW